jgi:cell division protein FtsI/penicillin-binding protein 2
MFNRNITEIKAVLKNVVKRDRVKTLLKGLSMAGKTGTAKLIMAKMVGQYYASSL